MKTYYIHIGGFAQGVGFRQQIFPIVMETCRVEIQEGESSLVN